ncbi:formyltransferase [Streptomyces rectiverticillatus]|uniref:formyltransferase family protein n=1 Tax=Streptomyces rectiverticillatus TaxID=173860 RepID=UPI0015C3689A|nr:formyltransferase family protein [Streptomyces rectiverticillatus]QLE75304.1 formyltransferase [Streptomyces rectiverticillatus]
MTVVLFAYHDVGCRTVEVLDDLGVGIACVYTHRDAPGENTWFGSVAGTAASLNIPVRHADPRTAAEQEHIRALAPRALFSAYWRRILPAGVLALAPVAVNLHGSLLPRYRGRAPVNWQILHGEREGGVSLHHMVAEPDAGDLVDQESFPIGADDTPVDVHRKLLPATEAVLRRSARPVIDGSAPRWPQLASKATTFGRRRPADGLIDFRHSAEDVRNLIRAVTHPYPGAFCYMGPHKLTIRRAGYPSPEPEPLPHPGHRRPGEVHTQPSGVFVVCGDGRRLRLDEVELDGRRCAPADLSHVLHHQAVLGQGGGAR